MSTTGGTATRLTEVDGVVVRRDDAGRVIACLPGGHDPAPVAHRWMYGYDDVGLSQVIGPHRSRSIGGTSDGRVRSVAEQGVTVHHTYAADGVRHGAGRPLHDHIDDAGRCWATRGESGGVRHIYIWDGSRCLGRIDGPVGAPLAQVYSLDPSATPVRVIASDSVTRVPRDAFGEGLLTQPGVPGLFGGQVHGGLVHLPLRRLDPVCGAFCEPDPLDGSDDDPRRMGERGDDIYDGPLVAELDPRSPYEVCRGDPIGRADPTGGVSAGLIVSDLTWSFQNNLLSFFGIDWWFNMFASLIVAPAKALGADIDYDFFSSTGLMASDRHGGFGVRRGGIINAITGGRAFTTQHIVWSPDHEFAELERGEVIDPGGVFVPSHYGTVLAITPTGSPTVLLRSMSRAATPWLNNGPIDWSRHGGVGVPVAPGALTPWFPTGGVHLDNRLVDTRYDLDCPMTELEAANVGAGTLEDRSFLTAASSTGLGAGDRVVVEETTNLMVAEVVAVVAVATAQRVQLDVELSAFATAGLSMTEVASAGMPQSHGVGGPTNSLDVRGTSVTYAANDLVAVTSSATPGDTTTARIATLQAQLPLDRPLPAGFGGPIAVSLATVSPSSIPVTVAGANLDVGAASRPGVGTTGIVSGGGVDLAVRVDGHAGASEIVLDVALPATISGAGVITYRAATAGTSIGARTDAAEVASVLTYAPLVAGSAPDGSTAMTAVHCRSGPVEHVRLVTGAPAHDVVIVDRPMAGAAPFTVERLTTAGTTIRGLTRADVMALVVDDPAPFAAAPAVYLAKVVGDPPTGAASPPLTAVDVVAGVISTTVAATGPGIRPSRPVLVGTVPAVIRTVRVSATFTGSFDLSASDLRLVGLVASGHAYLGSATAADEVLVEPTIDLAGTPVRVPFPRFVVGDLVAVTTRAGGLTTWHRVGSAAGGRLTLVDGPVLTPGDAIMAQHVITADPATGGPFLGIDGTRTGSGATSTATFSVWNANALIRGAVGIVDGTVTHPTTIDTASAQPIEITCSEAFSASGVDVALLTHLDDRFVTTLALDGGALLLDGAVGALGTAAGESIVAVAYTATGATTVGTIGPGTLLVPEDETTEVDRSQSLTDHELTHTLQYARWGPLWFNAFPMLAMELPGILATDTELPEYSAFLAGTLETGTADRWNLTLADTAGVSIERGDTVQVVQGSRRTQFTVHSASGDMFEVRGPEGASPALGAVSVRKKQQNSVFDGFYAGLQLLTHGGLMNATAGTTWGGIFWLIGKAFYGLGRAIGGSGELYPATVLDGGGALSLTNPDDIARIKATGTVVVRQGDNTVVRTMTRTASVITLTEGVSFTGDVQTAMYDTHEPDSDWYDYYPATVDPTNPHVIEVAAAGDDTLQLGAEDRVVIRYGDRSPDRTDVIAVTGSAVELLDPIPITGGEVSLRIAKIGASDPLGNLDSALMVEMGMGWMKWIFDPYGQIEYAVDPDEDWARWLLRVMRWLLGTQNFSLLPFGYLWWGRLFREKTSHETAVEQEASEESGDLYSPLGRLFGERTDDGYARYRMVVGDIARYRLWSVFRGQSYVERSRLDAPGVHLDNVRDAAGNLVVNNELIRTMPDRTGGGAVNAPNGGFVAGAAAGEPGRAVAEAFTVRDDDPRLVARGVPTAATPPLPPTDPIGFRPSDLGRVPERPRTERMISAYVSFTRPGDHRVTTVDDAIFDDSLDAFNEEAQELFFDVTATDVTVTVAGQTVDDTTPGTSDVVTLIPFQRAQVVVTPNGARTYRLALTDPNGPAVGTDGLARLLGVGASPDSVEVEVSRFHAAVAGAYASGGLAFAGMHLSRDVHIPVRRFSARVVDTLPLRAGALPTSAVVTTLAHGDEGFVLVPAPIDRVPQVTTIGGVAPPTGDPSPVSRAAVADSAAQFLGVSGSTFRIQFPAAAPTGEVVITVRVGDGTASTDLTARFTLT